MVDAGGHRLEMILMGDGTPAVVVDAGMSGGMAGWNTARDSVALHTRTVIFDLPDADHGSILGETVLREKIIEAIARASGR